MTAFQAPASVGLSQGELLHQDMGDDCVFRAIVIADSAAS